MLYPSCKANSAPCQSINVGLNWFYFKVSYVRHCSFPHPRPNPFKLNRLQQQLIEKKVTWNPKRLKLNQKDATRSPAWANEAPKTAVCKKNENISWPLDALGSSTKAKLLNKCGFREPFGGPNREQMPSKIDVGINVGKRLKLNAKMNLKILKVQC